MPERPHVALGEDDHWRLTVDGWEWMRQRPPAPRPLTLHPLTVAAFQCLSSIWALMFAIVLVQVVLPDVAQMPASIVAGLVMLYQVGFGTWLLIRKPNLKPET